MSGLTPGDRRDAHAVYPGTFDPFTAGHRDVLDRVRRLFDRITVLVAVNEDKQPAAAQSQRLSILRGEVPVGWSNVEVMAWTGLTAAFCHEHRAGVIVRGIRNHSDVRFETKLAAMNEDLGVTTLLVPTRTELVTVSSTMVRSLSA